MWKAAVLGQIPTISVLDTVPSDGICKDLDLMLFDPSSQSSCFADEVRIVKMGTPTLKGMMSRGTVYIVGMRGRIVACACVTKIDDAHYISSLCVRACERNGGVGRMLMRHIVNLYPRCMLNVLYHPSVEKNARKLVKFYKSLGFSLVSRQGMYLTMMRGSPTTETHLSGF